MTPKQKAIKQFQSFLDRLAAAEAFSSYSSPKLTKSKGELILTAKGVDEQAKDDPWTTHVVWKKDTNNLFYFREYKDGGYQTQKEAIKAKGEESLAVLLTKLLSKIKKNG